MARESRIHGRNGRSTPVEAGGDLANSAVLLLMVPTGKHRLRGTLTRVAEGSERDTELPQSSEAAPVAVGTAVWALLFVIGLVIRPALEHSGRGWWVWSAGCGVVLGFLGFYLLRRHARQVAAGSSPARDSSSAHGSAETGSGPEFSVQPRHDLPPAESPIPDHRPAGRPVPDSRTPDRS